MAGWITVLLYVIAAWATWRLLRDWKQPRIHGGRHERWFWRLLFVGLILLAINKQLDLQSAFTELGRMAANRGGWYADRRQVQMAFIAGIAILGLTLFVATLYLTWGAPAATQWALLGATGLVMFVLVRAASFHHVDTMLGSELSGVRVNWLLEMGGLMVIIVSVWCRHARRLSSPAAPEGGAS